MAIFHKLSKDDMKKVIKEEPKEQKKVNVPNLILRIVEILISLAYVVFFFFGRLMLGEGNEFATSLNFLAKENPMPWVRSLSYVMLILIIGTLLRIILKALSKNEKITKKTSVAVLQLLRNLVKYVMVIMFICLGLGLVGVDTAAIIGGLGIFALVIGLGVTSLIEDIVAGIFIISERTFDVGDIIVVDGFRGTVISIGVRSTKIADVGGDIRTMRNSSIGAVVNLTDRMSCAALTFPISPDESLEHVEEVIKNGHIEEIQKTCDKMEGAPIYLGLCEITARGVQMLLFIAACKEENRYDVERALFHGLKLLFDQNNIKLGHNEVIIDDQNTD